ncbi:peptide chain release factor 1-like, mitochondrial [Diadema antillarum]|uniref:peptide chain release factor 1-like, mitochondrial n=1 Tax=Diadema antillarum TaxID=105358 RepID=UPI003A835C1C
MSHHSECDSGCRERWYGTSSDSETGDPLSPSSVQFRYYMDHLRKEHQLLSEKLQGGETLTDSQQRKMRAELFELSPIIDKWEELNVTEQELQELDQMIEGSPASSQDKEMQELAVSEKAELCSRFEVLKEELIELLMPSEDTDNNDILMEFSAGVGGQEAMLFASDMFEMYQRYTNFQGWTFNVLEYFTTDIGGLRHASVSVSGEGAYRLMRHEGGVHRVQRVPKTERQGRVHTSTMTIAVLPQPKEIDLKLDSKDLKIETKKASGAGGQHVNTTDSAVRITHIPTGITAESQQERSQHKNKSIAMTMLQTRIYNIILAKQESSERTLRLSQVGSSGRSEKIRTYNFQQDRITDHRIGRSVHDVQEYLSGSDLLDDMIQSVVEEDALMELKRRILDVFDTR